MAIVQEDEDTVKNRETPVGGGTSYVGGGMSGQGGGSAPAPTQPKSEAPGTGYVNIQDYLRGSNGGGMASDIAGNAGALGSIAHNSITNFGAEANKQAAAGVPVLDNNALTAPKDYAGPKAYNEGGLQDPFANAKKATNDTSAWLKNSGTTEGLQTQFKGMYGDTNGQSKYDTLITQGTGQPLLNDAQQRWGGIGDYLGNTQNKATDAIKAAGDQSKLVGYQWQAAQDAKALKDKTDRQAKDAKDKADLDARNKANKPGYIVSNTPISSPSNSGTVTSTIPTAGYTGSLAIQPPADAGTLEYQQPNAIVGRNTRLNDPNNYPFLGQFMINR